MDFEDAKVPAVSKLGARGERPVFFPCHLPWSRIRELTSIPGVARVSGGLACTWDVAPILAALLEVPCPTSPVEWNLTEDALRDEAAALPGLARYRQLELNAKLRDYQKEGALFLSRRAYAMQCDPMRAGKTIQALAASVLIDAQRTLIIAPALAKYVWAEECAKWIKEEAIILEGRSGDFARRYCRTCDARGRIDGGYCPDCKLRNGQANGYQIFDTWLWEWNSEGEPTCVCPKHPEASYAASMALGPTLGVSQIQCPSCLEELHEAISAARYIICNYDILVASKSADARGALHVQENLRGWAPALARHKFDLAILDESHMIRGFSTDQSRKGQTRRERVCEVTENIPTVWALTGTPIFGFVRDLWGQLDAISKGAVTGNGVNERAPFTFHAYFCEGHKDDYGWRADGRDARADTELPPRLDALKIQRPRSLILAQMPAKVRQVIRIDPKSKVSSKIRGKSDEARLAALLTNTLAAKIDAVVENVISEVAQGDKVVVFAYLRDSVTKLQKGIDGAMKNRDNRTRMREVKAEVWAAHGDTSPQGRFEMARAFREHVGGGVFIATIDSVQVAVSLKGASSVHFADLHWQPAALLQAEDRPYEVGITGLSIIYYIVRGSVDEHIEATVLPKVKTLAQVVAEKGATELQNALAGGKKQQSLKEILADLMKGVDTDLDAFDD